MWSMPPYLPLVSFYFAPQPTDQYCSPAVCRIPVAVPVPVAPPEREVNEVPKHIYFTESDDLRLIEVMKKHTHRPLRCREWNEIAADFGKFSVRQCRERWHNYLKPPLVRTEFTIPERREILTYALTDYGHWERIAGRIGNGKVRSPAMVKNMLSNLVPKLRKMGFEVRSRDDVDCLPDVVFQWGYPSYGEQHKLLIEYNEAKQRRCRRAEPIGQPSPGPFSIQAILS
jgi:hypothetical protein